MELTLPPMREETERRWRRESARKEPERGERKSRIDADERGQFGKRREHDDEQELEMSVRIPKKCAADKQ